MNENAPARVLITNVRVFDGTGDTRATDMNVLVVGNTIEKVSKSPIKADGPVTVLDGGGRTLMPGLIDMHAHLGLQEGMLEGRDDWDNMAMGAMTAHVLTDYLQQGFTTARDIGSQVLGIARAVKAGRLPGPRIYPSGAFLTQTSGHADVGYWTDCIGDTDYLEATEFGYVADGRDEVLKAVRHNLRKGATQIKVMAGGGVSSNWDPIHVSEYTLDEMRAAVEAAEDWGTYVAVHAYHDRSVTRAIDAGVRCIEHGFLVSEPTVVRMAQEGVAWSLQGYMSYTAFAKPDEITYFTDPQRQKARQVHDGVVQVAKWAREHGVLIVSGGDMFSTPFKAMQIENVLVETALGFTPVEALRHATSNAAEVLNWCGELNPYPDGKLGVIEEGAYADLLLVEGNPLEDLTVLRPRENLRVIMKDGTIYKNTLAST